MIAIFQSTFDGTQRKAAVLQATISGWLVQEYCSDGETIQPIPVWYTNIGFFIVSASDPHPNLYQIDPALKGKAAIPPGMAEVEITEAVIEAIRTARGGFSKSATELIGVPWPLRTGWKRRAIGTRVIMSEDDAQYIRERMYATGQRLDDWTPPPTRKDWLEQISADIRKEQRHADT